MAHTLSGQSVQLLSSSGSGLHFRYAAALQRRLKTVESWRLSDRLDSLQNAGLVVQGMPENRRERHTSAKAQEYTLDAAPVHRRHALASGFLLLAMPTISLPALGQETSDVADGFKLYEDETDKYTLLVPPEWTKGEGKSGVRKVIAFFPAENTSTNVNVVITALGADYTKLGSFGTAEGFAENLVKVNGLDRSWTKPPGQAAKLVDARRSDKDYYYVEYTIQKPGDRKRHLISTVGIGFNGWYNRLFTVTGQFWEDEADKYRSQIQKAVASFKIP